MKAQEHDNPELLPDHVVIRSMRKYGGGFVQALAEAAMHADSENLQRIKSTWPVYWQQYAKLAKGQLED